VVLNPLDFAILDSVDHPTPIDNVYRDLPWMTRRLLRHRLTQLIAAEFVTITPTNEIVLTANGRTARGAK
jgi:hypothetical protein